MKRLWALPLLPVLFLAACQPKPDEQQPASLPEIITKVTKESYISGRKFCQVYSNITNKEHGRFVTVPKSYSDASKGTVQIYVYSDRAFDPNKETYLYVDGGPGQNTHGYEGYLNGEMNELRFDQRGLGCSAPDSWEEYADSDLYSTENTIRDMEEIRKAYGIKKWSLHGVSYGTVPSTMYASKYPAQTKTIVLEGTVGRSEHLHKMSYKMEKLNLMIKSLNSVQLTGFKNLIYEQSPEADSFYEAMMGQFYQERGIKELADVLPKMFSPNNGQVNRQVLTALHEAMQQHKRKYPLPQQPGAVDANVLNIIYCKNLDSRNRPAYSIRFSESSGFYTTQTSSTAGATCDEYGVTKDKESPFVLEKNPVTVPIYYFQGSHDGATLAAGAKAHWQVVPRGKSVFLLALKGGHNPNLARLSSENKGVKAAQTKLFKLALTDDSEARGLSTLVNEVNNNSDLKWKQMTSPFGVDFESELEGIKNVAPAQAINCPL